MTRKYQECTKCVMDTSDPEIYFDDDGVCNHCLDFENITKKRWFPNEEGEKKLVEIFGRVKEEGKNQDYDCIMGLSGGIDSSYLALKLKNYGLRPLVVHVDAGWNSELAVYNIEQVIKYCGYDLYTHVMNWEEVKDLQVSYLKAGVANQDVVQDHAFFATLYHFAVKNKIRYVISGGNLATESVFPVSWHHSAMDAINLRDIHRKHGKLKLKNYKTINIFQYYLYYPFVYKMKTLRPLNFMPYNKQEALEVLKNKINYKDYGRKHGESLFTKFFQNYYLPVKFNMDKRRPHLSSMILSGQMTRAQALEELKKPLYDERELRQDMSYIAKKLDIDFDELEIYVNSSGVNYKKYKNWDNAYTVLKKIQSYSEKFLKKEIKNYA